MYTVVINIYISCDVYTRLDRECTRLIDGEEVEEIKANPDSVLEALGSIAEPTGMEPIE